jgi:VanZ family protein
MEQPQRVVRQWLIGYVALLFAMLPLALPCWNAFLRDSVGRFITIEQIHLLQYMGLGALAAGYVVASRRWAGALGGMALLLLGCGLLDEVVQRWLPQRVFDWTDVFLNWAGGFLGAAGSWMVISTTRRVKGLTGRPPHRSGGLNPRDV